MLDRWVPLSPVSPTPVQPMERLGRALDLEPGRLWVKRDDLTGLGRGGGKLGKILRPFPRMHYDEAVKKVNASGASMTWGDDFGAPQEEAVAKDLDRPVMVHRYPAAIKAFYMQPDPADAQRARPARSLPQLQGTFGFRSPGRSAPPVRVRPPLELRERVRRPAGPIARDAPAAGGGQRRLAGREQPPGWPPSRCRTSRVSCPPRGSLTQAAAGAYTPIIVLVR